MTTPDNISSLKESEVFVFGSNLNGNHIGGAAALAREKFGAVDGVGEGLEGNSYAFPTLNKKMKKVSLDALKKSKELLYKCANENTSKRFYVTKLGCGIAGFTEEEMKQVFEGEKPRNVALPIGWSVIRGYKAMTKDMKCRDFQFEVGKEYTHNGRIELCASGFHFCMSLGDVYSYYDFGTDIVVCEIEATGEVVEQEDGQKSVTDKIVIVRTLGTQEASNNKGNLNTGHSNTGESNTGDRNTGQRNTGHWNTGDRNTGHRNTGHWNTGHWNTVNFETGHFNTEPSDTIRVFNKECSRKEWENTFKPDCLYFDTKRWIFPDGMTDEEKEENPSYKTANGFLKTIEYKEAFRLSMEKASSGSIELVKKLPNFDAKVFFEISGFKIK